jgi:hypothetical protein
MLACTSCKRHNGTVDVCYVELPSELWKNSATQYQEEERGLKLYMCCLLVGLQLL